MCIRDRSTTTITEANKKNSDWTCTIQCVGGTTSGTTITLSPNQGPTTTINIVAWSQSVDDTHSVSYTHLGIPFHDGRERVEGGLHSVVGMYAR